MVGLRFAAAARPEWAVTRASTPAAQVRIWRTNGKGPGLAASLDFQIDASSPSKRPEQFAALLDSALRRPLRRTPGGYGIQRLGKLEKLEDRCGEAAHSRRTSRIQ